jgi:hypothetical protein
LSKLRDIPIHVEPTATVAAMAATGGLGGGVGAILSQLVGLLETLAQQGTSAIIDLCSLPMGPEDRLELQRVLGDGEVKATVEADGLSRIRETGISGVWWVEQFDRIGALSAEMIEVAMVPQILSCAKDEIIAGAHALQERLSATLPPSGSESHVTFQ